MLCTKATFDYLVPKQNTGLQQQAKTDCEGVNRVRKKQKIFYASKQSPQPTHPDITTELIGDFGKWQLKINILMALLKLSTAWFQLNIVFMAPPQDFWCAKPDTYPYSEKEWRDTCAPLIEDRPCLIFDPDFLDYLPDLQKTLVPLVKCPQFVYDKSVFTRTIISDWDLVCSDHWYIHLTQCVVMSGVLFGSLIFGKLADKYGRKGPLMAAIVLQSMLCFVASIIPQYWWFLPVWFIVSLADGGISLISFVICLESISGKYRTTVPILHQLPFFFGNVIVAVLAYWLRDWRKLDITIAFLSSFYITYWFLIPESPRWLLATGRTDEAYALLKEIAAYNKMPFPKHLIQKERFFGANKKHNVPGFMDFLRSKRMKQKTILLSIIWFCSGLSFYTFSQYLGSFGGNIFVTMGITGCISCFGGIFCVCTITRMGRKVTLGVFQLITALCFVLILLIPEGWHGDWPRLISAGVGFAGMAGSIPAMYLFSGELFPTQGRNVGVGGVNTFARIGSMIAPFILSLRAYSLELPLILLTIMSFAQIILLIPLPDTKDRALPDTLEEAELF